MCGESARDCHRRSDSPALQEALVRPGSEVQSRYDTDTQKATAVFGTVIIVLPSALEGGEVVAKHAGRKPRNAVRDR